MKLGAFSISLAAKDLQASRAFYEAFGFRESGGNATQNWLILKNGDTVITMPNAFLRVTLALLIATSTGCATGRVGVAAQQVSAQAHTIVLVRGQQAVIADESLTVELTGINDSRCPVEVTCIWAGHAAVTLQVDKPGSHAGRVVIGTEAPDSMGLPGDADYDGYSFQLVELERGKADGSTADVLAQRATIKVSRLPQGQ